MFGRFVTESLRRSPGRKAMAIAAVALGTAVAMSMLGVLLDIGDQVGRELRSLGANILVTPRAQALATQVAGVWAAPVGQAAFIPEDQLPRIKRIFWGLNIIGFSPSLQARSGDLPVEGLWFHHAYPGLDRRPQYTGAPVVNSSWQVKGRWLLDDETQACLVGAALARRLNLQPGSTLQLFGQPFTVAGILESGGDEDERVILPLAIAQSLTHRPNQVDAVQVSALTKPEDDFARKDPKTMAPEELERWSCTNYVTSIAHQITEALPMAVARPVRRVAEGEGKVLSKISGLMLLIALVALVSAALTVWSVTAATMLERRDEIAIMQATGATDFTIGALLATEVALQGLLGGLAGGLAGVLLARWVGQTVFHVHVDAPWLLLPVLVLAAVAVSVAGAIQPVRRTLLLDPAIVLREGL
ncbi:MAG TPA: hypothetical protein DEQ47_14240 [Solibacterales bacterium]|jgi:putative ABC transport system permease protein|nr:hypothetical protein [Bryobacterales bacterium]